MHDPNGSGKPLPEPVALVFGQAEATSAGQLNTEAFRQQFGPAAFDEATNSAGVAVMRKPTIGQSGKAQVFAAVVAAMSSVLMTTKFDHTSKKEDVLKAYTNELANLVNNPVDSKKRKAEGPSSDEGACETSTKKAKPE